MGKNYISIESQFEFVCDDCGCDLEVDQGTRIDVQKLSIKPCESCMNDKDNEIAKLEAKIEELENKE